MDSLSNIIITLLGTDAVRDECHYPDTVPSFMVPRERFIEAARGMKKAGARLVAEWATDEGKYNRGFGIYTCYSLDSEYIIINCRIPTDDPTFPSLTKKFVPASRFERQMRSLMGVTNISKPYKEICPCLPLRKADEKPHGCHPCGPP